MIRVAEHIDEIVQQCFDNWVTSVLEFSINQSIVTVKDQFLYHYENACYLGTKESLIRAIKYRIHLNMELLLRLQDFQTNMVSIVNLGEYNKVRLRYREELGTESSIGSSASAGDNANRQTEQFSGADRSKNLNISDNRTAISNTNRVDDLKVIIPQPEIKEAPINTIRTKYTVGGENTLVEADINYKESVLNNPQQSDEAIIGYQNYTKDLSTNETVDTNNTNTSRGTNSLNKFTSRSASTNVKGNKEDEHERIVEFVTNEGRIKMWSKELPRLKNRFWNGLYNLFIYDQI